MRQRRRPGAAARGDSDGLSGKRAVGAEEVGRPRRRGRTLLGLALCTLVVGTLAQGASATHFRYGNIVWTARTDISPQTASFSFTAGFRRCGYAGSAADGCPAVGDVITEFIGATALEPGDGTVRGSPLRFRVTAVNPIQDWLLATALDPVTGDDTIVHTYPSPTKAGAPWTAALSTCCRITTPDHINNNSGNYRIETTVELASGNRPPRSAMSPIVSCELGALCQFAVPANDPDGDRLRFRLSTPCEAAAGCGFRQPGPPYAPNALTIDPTTGLVTWDTTAARISTVGYGLYSTQVTVEDLDAAGNAKAKIAVDFFIRVAPVPPHAPHWVSPPTPTSGSTLTVSPGSELRIQLRAGHVDANERVELGDTGLPLGMSCDYGVAANPVNGSCSWRPTALQTGEHIVIFTATETHGVGAPPRVLTIRVEGGYEYVAVGDSTTTGFSVEACEEDRTASPYGCLGSPPAPPYPERIAAAGDSRFDELERKGIWGYGVQEAVQAYNTGSNGDRQPWEPQLIAAEKARSLVTVSLGVNDMQFSDFQYWLRACVGLALKRWFLPPRIRPGLGLRNDDCKDAALGRARAPGFQADLDAMYEILEGPAARGAKVVTLLYYNPFNRFKDVRFLPDRGCSITHGIGEIILGALNPELERRAAERGFGIVDLHEVFDGHGAGERGDDLWVFGTDCELVGAARALIGSQIDLQLGWPIKPSKDEALRKVQIAFDPHPNERGTEAQANAVLEVVR